MKRPFQNAPMHGRPLAAYIVNTILPGDRLIDVGPGIKPYGHSTYRTHLCIEPHWEYAEVLSEGGYPVMQTEAVIGLPLLRNFEVILFIDVIEHMTKKDGIKCLKMAEEIATKQVVVFTPLGFMKQEPEGDEPDPWGYDGWEWQRHRSGWTPEDFQGWEISVDKRFHEDHGAFAAVLNK